MGLAPSLRKHLRSTVVAGHLLWSAVVAGHLLQSSAYARSAFESAVTILERAPLGRLLLEQARTQWKLKSRADLFAMLQWGGVSKTDSVLTRHFDPTTGKESRERVITIFLKQSSSTSDLALDLAHELTHALDGPSWDPYDPNLTPGKYIWESLEGRGGEIDALTNECQVVIELVSRKEIPAESVSRCTRYLGRQSTSADGLQVVGSSVIDRKRVQKDFYNVGRWKAVLEERLGGERGLFPHLNPDSPQLLSSTGNTPYPVSLYEEFFSMTKVACENMRNRYETSGRAPASSSDSRRSSLEFLNKRCGHLPRSQKETQLSSSRDR